jgi:hypothetical protein
MFIQLKLLMNNLYKYKILTGYRGKIIIYRYNLTTTFLWLFYFFFNCFFPKIFFFLYYIKTKQYGWWINAISRLWRTRYLPYR